MVQYDTNMVAIDTKHSGKLRMVKFICNKTDIKYKPDAKAAIEMADVEKVAAAQAADTNKMKADVGSKAAVETEAASKKEAEETVAIRKSEVAAIKTTEESVLKRPEEGLQEEV